MDRRAKEQQMLFLKMDLLHSLMSKVQQIVNDDPDTNVGRVIFNGIDDRCCIPSNIFWKFHKTIGSNSPNVTVYAETPYGDISISLKERLSIDISRWARNLSKDAKHHPRLYLEMAWGMPFIRSKQAEMFERLDQTYRYMKWWRKHVENLDFSSPEFMDPPRVDKPKAAGPIQPEIPGF